MPKRAAKRIRDKAIGFNEDERSMSMDLTKYVTTKQAASMLGVNRFRIVQLLLDKRIKGIKLGHDWLVFAPSVEKYIETKSKRGRPPSGVPQLQEAN